MAELTHLDKSGAARMVDVADKPVTSREAVAQGRVSMKPETLTLALSGDARKGSVRAAAEFAGIMAAKRTAELIPLCHQVPLSSVTFTVEADEKSAALIVTARARSTGQTGVEMEALVAVSVACLTIYDMLKAADRAMVIGGVMLLEKRGGIGEKTIIPNDEGLQTGQDLRERGNNEQSKPNSKSRGGEPMGCAGCFHELVTLFKDAFSKATRKMRDAGRQNHKPPPSIGRKHGTFYNNATAIAALDYLPVPETPPPLRNRLCHRVQSVGPPY